MKIFFSEYQAQYASYTFSYAVYCLKEKDEELPQILEKGFLPYTDNLTIKKDIFYMARSVRINLEDFKDTSENKRVDRKIIPLNIELKVYKKREFTIDSFLDFCLNYAGERFADGNMDRDRFNYIFNKSYFSHIFVFQSVDEIYGYVFGSLIDNVFHYWYAFFNTGYMREYSLGKWMMWKIVSWAKESGLNYIYIGTAYKTKALYKIRDHKGIEFFDGFSWNNDTKLLKHLCRTDEEKFREQDILKSDGEIQSIFNQLFNN